MKPPAEDLATAQRVIIGLTLGDSLALAAELDSTLATAQSWAQLRPIRDSFVAWAPDSARLVGWHVVSFTRSHSADLTYQLTGRAGWLLLTASVKRTAQGPKLIGLHWQLLPGSLETLNRFTLEDKPFGAYLALLVAGLMALTSLGVAVVVACSRMPRRWLWAFVALLGATRFYLNWTTGAVGYSPLDVQLFSAGIAKTGPYAPWVVSFSLPLGALLSWQRLRRWRHDAAASPPPPAAV